MAQEKVSKQDINEFLDNLESSNFFKYVKQKEEVETYKKLQTKHLAEYGWLVFPSRTWIIEERTGENYSDWKEPFDYYFLQVSGDDMFSGDLKFYFEQISKLFEVRNLNLQIGEENMVWGEKDDSKNYHYFKHEIEINGKNILFAEGNLNQMGPLTYIKKFTEILKEELKEQNSAERLVMITFEDGVNFLLAEVEIINIYKSLPNGVENKIIEE